jgi:hypothetical protein
LVRIWRRWDIKQKNGVQIIILVEAKYKSGKSSEATDDEDKPYDQLAREWDNLLVFAKNKNAKPYLLYVTPHFSYPKEDIEEAQFEFMKKRSGKLDVVWISWRKLPTVLNGSAPILKDLIEILRKQGLTFFDGISIPQIGRILWTFQKDTFNWKPNFSEIKWRFVA